MLTKTPDVKRLVTATILVAKIGEVKNKILNVSGLVTTIVFDTKIREVENKIPDHAKYITTPEFKIFTGTIFDAKLKQVNLATNDDLNAVLQPANKIKKKSKRKTTNTGFKLLSG